MARKSHSNLSDVDPTKKLLTDASSLVDLKAELFKKYQEAQVNKIYGKKSSAELHSSSSGSNVWSKSNIGIQSRAKRDQEASEEDKKDLGKVQEVLERKSKLYDQLKEGQGHEEVKNRFLVNFNQEDGEDSSDEDVVGNYPAKNSEEEWVEYTDALGRTRTCMKKDLKQLKKQDKDILANRNGRDSERPDLMSEDMRREMLRQKWEKEEEENLKKKNLHYGDILFDEARTHGAAFYKFSRDEATRASEQEDLKRLHEETSEARIAAKKKKEKAEKALQLRLKRVRDRKRLKMGLPILPDENDPSPESSEASKVEDTPDLSLEQSVLQGLRTIREENEEKQKEIARKNHVREWDVGKEGVKDTNFMKGEKKILSQDEWVSQKRKLRNNEFAPPTSYQVEKKSKGSHNYNQTRPCRENISDNSMIPLPDMSVPPPQCAIDPMKKLEDSHEALGIVSGPMPRPDTPQSPGSNHHHLNSEERLKLHKRDTQNFASNKQSSNYAEIAPPCDMDYYSSGFQNKSFSREKFFRSRADMTDAFNAGLKSIKKKADCNNSDDSD